MKKKELMYANEYKDYKMCIIITLIFAVLFSIVNLVERNSDYYLFSFICFLFLSFGSIFANYKSIKFYKNNLNIKRNGQRLDGYIMDLEHSTHVGMYSSRVNYYLIVKYFNPFTKQDMLYKTPLIGFNPIDDLGDRKCSVYIYNNEIYVSDFVLRLPNQNRVWSEEYVKTKNFRPLLWKEVKRVYKILGIILLLLMLIPILIGIFG